jgi:hypothetical protein
LPLFALTAGVAMRDCVVMAAAGPLALSAFLAGMDEDAPMDAFRAAIRSALAGVAAILVALALAVMVLAAVHGFWQPVHELLLADVGLLTISFATFAVHAQSEGHATLSGRQWMVRCAALAVGAVVAVSAWNVEWSVCALPLATATFMALAGWRLLREVASEFLAIGRER